MLSFVCVVCFVRVFMEGYFSFFRLLLLLFVCLVMVGLEGLEGFGNCFFIITLVIC